jgi:hypothetical protein
MRHFFEWFEQHGNRSEPWLVLGKGPTFGLRDRFDLSGYHLLSLNHAVREQPVLLAHMIDLDVVDACAEALRRQAGHVVLPWYPHVNNAPGPVSLGEIVPAHPLLRELSGEGRLLWYDLSTSPRRYGPGPVVRATYFSAEAAVGLLALAGVTCVRSLGVDGGAGYSTAFEDLNGRTLLANGQPGFDLQFQGIARTILRTGLDFAPLDQPSPIEVRIVSGEASGLPGRVLEFTVRRHTSMSVRVRAGQSVEEAGTSPGGARAAIVLHDNALVFDDLRKLWSRPPASDLPESWNRRDWYLAGDTSLLLYDAPALRPWNSRVHPFGHLWVAALLEAVQEGFISADQIRTEVREGRVRPSLLEQVERGSPEGLLVSWSARRGDAGFTPPGGLPADRGGRLVSPLSLLRAFARQARRRAGDYRRRRLAHGG